MPRSEWQPQRGPDGRILRCTLMVGAHRQVQCGSPKGHNGDCEPLSRRQVMRERMNVQISSDLVDRLAQRAIELGITTNDLIDHILEVDRTPVRRPTFVASVSRPSPVFCSCCSETCRKVFTWRNVARCDCPRRAASL